MSLAWFFRIVDRTHLLVLPAVVVVGGGLFFGLLIQTTEGGIIREALGPRRMVGTFVLFVLLPAYLIGALTIQRRRTIEALEKLAPYTTRPEVEEVRRRIGRVSGFVWWVLVVGVAFGISQNPIIFEPMIETGRVHPLDLGFAIGACLIWVVVGFVLAWHLPLSRALSRLGERVSLDLFRLDRMQPLSRIATGDVLMVAGAMVFTPLQSLDAQFRFGNYWSALLVGIPAAVILFLLPLWGLHRNIRGTKARRIQQLEEQIEGIDREDLAELEVALSHLDRVRSLPAWPVDFELVSRIFASVVIPPLAWVAAALVENLVDRF